MKLKFKIDSTILNVFCEEFYSHFERPHTFNSNKNRVFNFLLLLSLSNYFSVQNSDGENLRLKIALIENRLTDPMKCKQHTIRLLPRIWFSCAVSLWSISWLTITIIPLAVCTYLVLTPFHKRNVSEF